MKSLTAALSFSPSCYCLASSSAGRPQQKVRIGYPSSAVSTLPFRHRERKGFFTKAGLDVEYIQMRSAIGPQAIMNGNINFFTSPQAAINAAVAGLPLVVVLSLYRDTPWVLVTKWRYSKRPGSRRQKDCHLRHPFFALLFRARRIEETRLGRKAGRPCHHRRDFQQLRDADDAIKSPARS